MTAAPQTIGPYRILEPLGHGGMGVVYRAEHRETGQTAALKTVRVPRAELLQSIRREIHALARIRHPGVVRILEEGIEAGLPWYAMELLEGTALSRYRVAQDPSAETTAPPPEPASTPWWTRSLPELPDPAADGATSASEAPQPNAGRAGVMGVLTLVRRLCSPLAFLHGEGIVHRDLKPDNILVVWDRGSPTPAPRSPIPVLTDFGLAALFGSGTSREALEIGGPASGTLSAIAPEQILGELVDARADLYSLGCLLYELVTGRPPFAGASRGAVLYGHLREEPAAPSKLAEGVPPELDALVLRLLAKEPRQRIG